jgi:hypothetical protein
MADPQFAFRRPFSTTSHKSPAAPSIALFAMGGIHGT